MILNHKSVLDYILRHPQYLREYTEDKIVHLHAILVAQLDIATEWRNHPVGIGGTLYRPIPKRSGIACAMQRLEALLKHQSNPYEKAFLAWIMIAYIQPFEDGNKRTSRIVSNALLYAHGCAMLSYRDVAVHEYKKAVILFYEQNNVSYLKHIFIQQFLFSTKTYFQ